MNVLYTFHIWQDGESKGPYTVSELRGMLKTGKLSRETLVAEPGGNDWLPLGTYGDVIDLPAQGRAVIPLPSVPPAPAVVRTKAEPGEPLTVAIVAAWLERVALVCLALGVVAALLGCAVAGSMGLWLCLGPFAMALTLFFFVWMK